MSLMRPFEPKVGIARTPVGSGVRFNVDSSQPCPCGSGRPAMDCCRDSVHVRARSRPPLPPATGFSHAKCYAAVTADCSRKLSREHPVSKAILERLNAGRRDHTHAGLSVTGLAWLEPGEARGLSPDDLASKILCTRHNSSLSPLDREADRLFGAIDSLWGLSSDASEGRLHSFNGHDIERWLLKVLCGFMASRQIVDDTKDTIPREWIDVLFHRRDWDPGQGMHVAIEEGSAAIGVRGLVVLPIGRRSEGGRTVGLTCIMHACAISLMMSPTSAPSREIVGFRHALRPLEIALRRGTNQASLVFTWESPGDGGSLLVEAARGRIVPRTPDAAPSDHPAGDA